MGKSGNVCESEQLALLLNAEGEISLSRYHKRFLSKENLPPLGVAAAFAGTLARRGALLLHLALCWLPLLPRELASTASQIPVKKFGMFVFYLFVSVNYFSNSGANILIVLLFVALECNISIFILILLYFYNI